MIYDLLLTFTGPQGCDSTGVPLLNIDRIWDIQQMCSSTQRLVS